MSVLDLTIDRLGKIDNDVIYKAEIVDPAPHLAMVASFAVIKFPNGLYRVTNIESGMGVHGEGLTKEDAIKEATEYLADKTPADILKAYKKWRKS